MAESHGVSRRSFLTGTAATLATTLAGGHASAAPNTPEVLQVWSCGGLAEAFQPLNAAYEAQTGSHISYTGAFAAALGKSLLAGNAQTEVFAPRVLELAKKLKEQGKMLAYQPLCFTKYVLITPKGNLAGIKNLTDLKRSDVHAVLSPDSSAPGGQAVTGLLMKGGVVEDATKNAAFLGSCVQHDVAEVAEGRAHASVVELRVTRLPRYKDKFEIIEIPEEYFPAPPIPFTIGIMKWAKNRDLAQNFVEYAVSEKGQAYFEAAGFVPAVSDEGKRLAIKYGVTNA